MLYNLFLLSLLVVKAMPRHAVTAVCMISSIVCQRLDVCLPRYRSHGVYRLM